MSVLDEDSLESNNDTVSEEIEVTQEMIDSVASLAMSRITQELSPCSIVDFKESLAEGFEEMEDLERALGGAYINQIFVDAIESLISREDANKTQENGTEDK